MKTNYYHTKPLVYFRKLNGMLYRIIQRQERGVVTFQLIKEEDLNLSAQELIDSVK